MKLFKKPSVRIINAVLISLIAIVFLAVLVICYQSLLRIDTDEYWEIHSYQVSGNINTLLSDIENMETGVRGYVITGQESFLEPYNTALPDVSMIFQTLQASTADNSVQQKNLAAMKPLIDAKITSLQNSISLRANTGFNAAQEDVLINTGKQTMDSIRAIVANMQAEESGLLQIRTKDLAQTNAATETIVIWGAIIGFLFYLLVNYIIDKIVIGKIVEEPYLKKEAQASFYARSLIEASLDPLVTISPEGKITDVNEATIKITGVPRDALIGTDFSDYFTEPQKAHEGYEQAFKAGFVVDYPLVVKAKDGKLTDVLYNASIYKDKEGNVLGVFAAARDNTLAKKVAALAEMTNTKLRELDVAKDEFVSIASHQLRTPLTALKGFTGMMLDGDTGPINDKQREYLTEIKKANDRMIELITSLLNVSRVDLNVFSIDPEPVKLEDVAKSVLEELDSKIKEKKLQIETNFESDLPVINLDLKITRMIFQNLLSNSVKYTPPEGSITLNIKKDAQFALISVADTGYGIPADAQSKIFTKMFRADNARTKDPDGTGLGLYIIKETIEKTGGKISFESKENQGTTFYVSIPLEGMGKRESIKKLQ